MFRQYPKSSVLRNDTFFQIRIKHGGLMGRQRVNDVLKECIADAILILVKNKPIEKITVEEVIEKAGVGRATYFRSFNSKQEAITFKLIRMWDQYCELNDIKVRNQFDIKNASAFFSFCYSIKHILEIIYAANLQETVHGAFYEVMLDRSTELNTEEYYREKFYLHGLFGLQDGWIKRGFKENPEEMTLIMNQILTRPHAKTVN